MTDRAKGDYSIRVRARFESAHFLRTYRGAPEPLHGHSYLVEAELAPDEEKLDSDAIAVDFVAARRALEEIAQRLDYTCINEVSPFDEINPSAENIAHWFHEQLGGFLESERAVVREIVLWEGPVNSVRYRPS